jgi:arylsulfatase A-like enzyme
MSETSSITRRDFLAASAATAAVGLPSAAASAGVARRRAASRPSSPNIILLFVDQMRGDAFGADGNRVVQTPNLDFLAARGTRFRHAYTACPSCLPARAILWTGMNQWHTGVLGMGRGQGPIPSDFPHTLPGELAKAGYRTHMIGKGHFNPQRATMGFDDTELDESGRVESAGFKDEYRAWFERNAPKGVSPDDHGINWNAWQARPWHTEEYLHPSAWTMSRAIQFLGEHDPGKPLFLNISFARPHSPYVPPQAYWETYINDPTPPPYVGEWAAMHDHPENAVDPDAWRGKMTDRQIHRARAGYFGEISFIDAQIGRLMNWMHRFRAGVFANTWFIFASDHGDMQGDHNLWRKTYAYEGSARIPFIVTPPGGSPARGRVADEVVELRDIMPTVLEIAGLPMPPTVDGSSLVPLVHAPATKWREYIHGEHCTCYSPEQEMQYVTDGKQKFIWLPQIGVEQFFDLTTDPGECRNLVADPAWQKPVDLWRGRLISELAARNCGWVKDGKLSCPGTALVSPYKHKRWTGA